MRPASGMLTSARLERAKQVDQHIASTRDEQACRPAAARQRPHRSTAAGQVIAAWLAAAALACGDQPRNPVQPSPADGSQGLSGRWLVTNDPSANHVARFMAGDGSVFDFWRSGPGDTILSQLRVRQSNGSTTLFQLDSRGRLAFLRDSQGTTLWINQYLPDGTVDATIERSDGASWRGIVAVPVQPQRSLPTTAIQARASVETAGNDMDACRLMTSAGCPALLAPALDLYCLIPEWVSYVIAAGSCFLSIETGVGALLVCALQEAIEVAFEDLVCRWWQNARAAALSPSGVVTAQLGEPRTGIPQPPALPIPGGVGRLQVGLAWDADSDLDLHVVEPSGEEIFYGNPRSASRGQLDRDSNAACVLDGIRAENIRWPTGQAPRGRYSVRVNHWSSCGAARTNYTVLIDNDRNVMSFSGFFTGPGQGGGLGAGQLIAVFERLSGPAPLLLTARQRAREVPKDLR